jgi:hypothetical protein
MNFEIWWRLRITRGSFQCKTVERRKMDEPPKFYLKKLQSDLAEVFPSPVRDLEPAA